VLIFFNLKDGEKKKICTSRNKGPSIH